MAIFRKLHTSFWTDTFIEDLDRDQKLFYIYLLTNDKTKQCGIYEISKKQISFDLGYSIDTVSKHLAYFIKVGKIKYNEATKELAIKNWSKYNGSTSPRVKTCVNNELSAVKDRLLIEYVYSIDTPPQEEQEEEEEKEEDSVPGFDKPAITKSKKELLLERRNNFKEDLAAFLNNPYKPDLLNKFYLHWSESDKSYNKMRFEKEKTWELGLRLAKWAANDYSPAKQPNNEKSVTINLP